MTKPDRNDRYIGIVFCGGCNPRIDRGKIAAGIQAALEADGCRVAINSTAVDYIIYLSGCTANCALKYTCGTAPATVVAAATIDTAVVAAGDLVTEIVTKVRSFYEQLERQVSE
ncbi:hypothetical protein [Sporomusa termitida]|uniref:Uncharacterized protein n=1 Tax=Sporomusa termitida TaxID=2377 RepID=A0A517DNR4_9FIRM|nr:hypothetical protein [Sporomusa termitida]QDR79010.1 hypothetical protein SPTER_02620 [Sporomusa termitida]